MLKMLVIVLAGSVATGLALRGDLRSLSRLELRGLPFVPPALVAGMLPLFTDFPRRADQGLLLAGNLLIAAFLVLNVREHQNAIRLGFAVIMLGWTLNAMAIIPNDGMPLSDWAYEQSGQTDPITAGEGGFFKIVVADEDTVLRPLGDVIPIRPLRQVLSIGDIALGVGIGIVITAGMTGARRRELADA